MSSWLEECTQDKDDLDEEDVKRAQTDQEDVSSINNCIKTIDPFMGSR